MPCNSCNKTASIYKPKTVYGGVTDCEYTVEQIIAWKTKLLCVQYDLSSINLNIKKYNTFIGTIYSVTEYPNNPCYFKKQLDEIAPYITKIINLNLC